MAPADPATLPDARSGKRILAKNAKGQDLLFGGTILSMCDSPGAGLVARSGANGSI